MGVGKGEEMGRCKHFIAAHSRDAGFDSCTGSLGKKKKLTGDSYLRESFGEISIQSVGVGWDEGGNR